MRPPFVADPISEQVAELISLMRKMTPKQLATLRRRAKKLADEANRAKRK